MCCAQNYYTTNMKYVATHSPVSAEINKQDMWRTNSKLEFTFRQTVFDTSAYHRKEGLYTRTAHLLPLTILHTAYSTMQYTDLNQEFFTFKLRGLRLHT
jgi:hypothetical protein